MKYYCFTLDTNSSATLNFVWEQLLKGGFELLYSSEEPPQEGEKESKKCLYGIFPESFHPEELTTKYPAIASFYPMHFDQVDWYAQWGITPGTATVQIDLEEYLSSEKEKSRSQIGQEYTQASAKHISNPEPLLSKATSFSMIPGPGFGFSHPTTRLVLQMMAPFVEGKWVIDLGSGSGILSLAAVKLGALGACGIDIDSEAIAHAQCNARLNQLEGVCHFQLPSQPFWIPKGVEIVLVMNMIHSEQKEAWKSLPHLHSFSMICITSGILQEEEALYHSICQARHWKLIDTQYESPWCGFLHCKFYGKN